MSSATARQRWRDKRTAQVQKFCRDYDMSLNPMNNGYQLRVENLVDFYPTNGRYCILQSGERGDFDTFKDMKAIMLRALPSVKVYDINKGEQPIHGIEITGVNKVTEHNVTPEPNQGYYSVPGWHGGSSRATGVFHPPHIDGTPCINIDMATGKSYSEVTYFRISRNWLHDKWLRLITRKKPNVVVVSKKVMEGSYNLKPDISKSVPKERDHE